MRSEGTRGIAGTVSKRVDGFLYFFASGIRHVGGMIDDARHRLMADTSHFRHFEHRGAFVCRIALACHAPSPSAHYRWYFRLFYTQLRLALTDAIFQPFERVAQRNSASRYAWRSTVYDWDFLNRHPFDFHAFVVVGLRLHAVPRLFESEHGGVGPRSVVFAV